MIRFLVSVLLTLLVAVVILAVVLAVTLGFVGVGWVVNLAFGMSLLQSTAIAVVVGFGVAYVIFRIFSMPDFRTDEDWEDWMEEDEDWDEWEDEEKEEDEPPIVPWRRHRPTPADPEEVERSRRVKK